MKTGYPCGHILTDPRKYLPSIKGVPHLRGFHYCGSHYCNFWLMYAQVGDFRVSRGPPRVLLTRILRNVVFFKSQNSHKAGTLCNYYCSSNSYYVLLSFNWQLIGHFSDLLQLSHFKWIKHFQRWWEQNRCLSFKWHGGWLSKEV